MRGSALPPRRSRRRCGRRAARWPPPRRATRRARSPRGPRPGRPCASAPRRAVWPAGVADGTIYHYFKSKDDLLLRLFDEKMTQLLAEAKAALAEERDAPSRLKRFIQLHFSLVEKNPDLASVLVVELRQSAQFLKSADRQKLGAAYLELIGQVVREGQERGELDGAVSPVTAKRAIFGALDELA